MSSRTVEVNRRTPPRVGPREVPARSCQPAPWPARHLYNSGSPCRGGIWGGSAGCRSYALRRSGPDRLAPPEIFHEILEHRWYLSEQAGRDVGITAAARSYVDTVLPYAPRPLTTDTEDGAAPAFSVADGPGDLLTSP
jgi:hypothetical protein